MLLGCRDSLRFTATATRVLLSFPLLLLVFSRDLCLVSGSLQAAQKRGEFAHAWD